jgi:hypothetical protein
MKKSIASVAAALLVGGTLAFATALPAYATQVDECVPAEAYTEVIADIEHPAVGEPTIANPEYVAAVPASTQWWNFAPNEKGPFEGTPTFPEDPNGVWVGPHTEGGPGQDQSGVYQQGEGNGSWFNRVNTPAKDAVGEPTIPNPEYVAAYTEITPDIEHPAVTCEQEPVVIEPVVCVAQGWYTESDDLEPSETEDGLLFYGGSGQAVGLRAVASGNLQGWTSLSFDATNVGDQFFFRLTIDASADGGKSYQSLSFPGTSTITQDSVSYQFGETLAATAERFPNAVITSIGFQTNSGAPEGFGAVLSSVSGCGLNVDFTYTEEEPPTEEPPTEEPPVVVPPVVEEPVVTPTPTETPVVATVASTDTLAATGGNDGLAGLLIAGILGLGGIALFAANQVIRARRR